MNNSYKNSIKNLLVFAVNYLNKNSVYQNHNNDFKLESEILLSHVLEKNRVYLHTWPEKIINEKIIKKFLELLEKKAEGIPIAYLIGKQEFFDLELEINENVLIPRPETEILIEQVLQKIPEFKALNILDLGTGSGAIALTIAKHRPKTKIYAVDKSELALNVAKNNALKLNIHNVNFILGNWFEPFVNTKIKFDFIVSNPPYIAPDDHHLITETIKFEPQIALVSKDNGLADIKTIIKNSNRYLNKNGHLFLEHGYNQQDDVKRFLEAHNFKNIQTIKDLNGNYRMTFGQF